VAALASVARSEAVSFSSRVSALVVVVRGALAGAAWAVPASANVSAAARAGTARAKVARA
jgi:hypothetical protein